jgi:hypothetical protein
VVRLHGDGLTNSNLYVIGFCPRPTLLQGALLGDYSTRPELAPTIES